jgi:hypothetical protein
MLFFNLFSVVIAVVSLGNAGADLTSFAGTGLRGATAGGGQAGVTAMNAPWGVWQDSNGVTYLSDTRNNIIRAVGSDGIVSKFAGGGSSGLGDNGPAGSAELNHPHGIWPNKDGSALLIADTLNSRVRKVVISTGIITTFVGNGESGNGGDNGQASAASMHSPFSGWHDGNGNHFISDLHKCVIRKVVESTGIITTFAGIAGTCTKNTVINQYAKPSGTYIRPSTLTMQHPGALHGDKDTLYVVELQAHRILAIDLNFNWVTVLAGTGSKGTSGDGGLAINAQLSAPYAVWENDMGDVYIAEEHAVRVIDYRTAVIYKVESGLHHPRNVWGNTATGSLFVSEGTTSKVGTAATHAVAKSGGGASLSTGHTMAAGQYLKSADGTKYAVLHYNGNLAVYGSGDGDFNQNKAYWMSNSGGIGSAPFTLKIDTDGTAKIVDSTGAVSWSSALTTPTLPTTLSLGNDGHLVLSDSAGSPQTKDLTPNIITALPTDYAAKVPSGSVWITPKQYIIGYQSDWVNLQTSPVVVGDQTIWVMDDPTTNANGDTLFTGTGYVFLYTHTSTWKASGPVVPTIAGTLYVDGTIRITFTTSTGAKIFGYGHYTTENGNAVFEMQQVSGAQTNIVHHWARAYIGTQTKAQINQIIAANGGTTNPASYYHMCYDAQDPLPATAYSSAPMAITTPWDWMVGTHWTFVSSNVNGGASYSMTVDKYHDGYLWLSGSTTTVLSPTTKQTLTAFGSITPLGYIIMNFADGASALAAPHFWSMYGKMSDDHNTMDLTTGYPQVTSSTNTNVKGTLTKN